MLAGPPEPSSSAADQVSGSRLVAGTAGTMLVTLRDAYGNPTEVEDPPPAAGGLAVKMFYVGSEGRTLQLVVTDSMMVCEGWRSLTRGCMHLFMLGTPDAAPQMLHGCKASAYPCVPSPPLRFICRNTRARVCTRFLWEVFSRQGPMRWTSRTTGCP